MPVNHRKPSRWAPVSRGLVAPEWRKFHDNLIFASLMWEGFGPIRDLSISHLGIADMQGGLGFSHHSVGRTLLFDGVDDQAVFTVGNNLSGMDHLSVIVYTFPLGFSNFQLLCGKGTATWILQSDAGGSFGFWGTIDASALDDLSGGPMILNVWQLVSMVYGNGVVQYYLDGRESGNTNAPLSGTVDLGSNNFEIGSSSDRDYFWNGHHAMALVYDRIVTQSELIQLAQDPFGPFRIDIKEYLMLIAAVGGRTMGSLAGQGGLAGHGGIAGKRGGIAG